jgi:tripartite-type tricarboxylate transporter receptor subunit TctC
MAPSMQTMLEKAILDVLASPEIKERLAAGGLQGARGSEGFKMRVASDVAYWAPAVRKLGISAE